MKILVTGATGFIGKNIVGELLKNNEDVYALVRSTSKTDFLQKKGVKFISGDITDYESLSVINNEFDAVIHCAAYVNDKNRKKLYSVNVTGTENVCKLCLRLKVRKLVYLSSVAVVSGNFQVPLTEDLPYSATNLYGYSKIEAEKIVWSYRDQGLAAAIIRPPMVYGEEEPHLLRVILTLLKYRLLPIINGGRNKLHLAYVKNVATAAVMALHNEAFLKSAYFVADKEVLTMGEIYSIFAQAISAPLPIVFSARFNPVLTNIPWLGRKIKFFLKDRVYDISRIENLGYQPVFPVREALVKTAGYFYPFIRKR